MSKHKLYKQNYIYLGNPRLSVFIKRSRLPIIVCYYYFCSQVQINLLLRKSLINNNLQGSHHSEFHLQF